MKTQDLVRELLEVTERFNRSASPPTDRYQLSHATNIIYLTSRIFADSSEQWLTQPNEMLDGLVPLDIIDSNEGLQRIKVLLEKISNVVDFAIEVFEDEDTGRNWLHTSSPYLENSTPISMFNSSEGIEKVRDMLGRIEYGVYS